MARSDRYLICKKIPSTYSSIGQIIRSLPRSPDFSPCVPTCGLLDMCMLLSLVQGVRAVLFDVALVGDIEQRDLAFVGVSVNNGWFS